MAIIKTEDLFVLERPSANDWVPLHNSSIGAYHRNSVDITRLWYGNQNYDVKFKGLLFVDLDGNTITHPAFYDGYSCTSGRIVIKTQNMPILLKKFTIEVDYVNRDGILYAVKSRRDYDTAMEYYGNY